jgi:hypothetical protein
LLGYTKVFDDILSKGSYLFQCEHDVDRTILNEIQKQYKSFEVSILDEKQNEVDVHRVKNEVFVKSEVRIQAPLKNGFRSFRADLIIDGHGVTGPFAVCSDESHFSGLLNATTLERIR